MVLRKLDYLKQELQLILLTKQVSMNAIAKNNTCFLGQYYGQKKNWIILVTLNARFRNFSFDDVYSIRSFCS